MEFKSKFHCVQKKIGMISPKQLEIIKVSLLAVIATYSIICTIQELSDKVHDVYAVDGEIYARAKVEGTVSIDNTVDVNTHRINGYRDVFFINPRRGEKKSVL